MISPFRMFTRATSRTTALVNRQWCAHCPTPSLECPTAYTNRRFHGIDLGRVLTNNRGSVRVFALEDRTNWLRAEFTMPTEAQYKAVAKIDGAIRFALWNRLDSIIRFPKPEQERRESRSKTNRRRQS